MTRPEEGCWILWKERGSYGHTGKVVGFTKKGDVRVKPTDSAGWHIVPWDAVDGWWKRRAHDRSMSALIRPTKELK